MLSEHPAEEAWRAHIQSFGRDVQDSIQLHSIGDSSSGISQDHGSQGFAPKGASSKSHRTSSENGTTQELPLTRIVFRQKSFRCLDECSGNPNAWVCEIRTVGDELRAIESEPKLFLSTDAETFADVWGPQSDPDQILLYCVGNGRFLE